MFPIIHSIILCVIISFLSASEVLSSSEHAAQLQRSEILEEVEQGGSRCYTLQSVEKVMKKVRAKKEAVVNKLCAMLKR